MADPQELLRVIEDLRKHTPEQLAELRLLLNAGLSQRPDSRRPGFFEIDGAANVYYILLNCQKSEAPVGVQLAPFP